MEGASRKGTPPGTALDNGASERSSSCSEWTFIGGFPEFNLLQSYYYASLRLCETVFMDIPLCHHRQFRVRGCKSAWRPHFVSL